MGLLVDGVWRDDSFDKARMEGGRFNRPTTKFRNWITPDGSAGPSGEGGFPAEAGRYHLYVSLACPWAHRTVIIRHLKRLENVVSMSVTARYTGRVTVPVLWDKKRQTIVSNESSEIIRMLNSAFEPQPNEHYDLYPPDLRSEIESVNNLIYPNINNGEYRAGFAILQEAYEEAFRGLFTALDEVERRLSRQRYLTGPRMTDADWRLITTLFRFVAVF